MRRRVYILFVMAMFFGLATVAQEANDTATTQHPSRRFVTPVKEKTNKVLLPGKDVDDKLLEQYLTGDTAKAREEARRDSIKKSYTHYPLLTDASVGFNFIELALAAAGQKHVNADFSFTLNMWNRLQPVLELGVGYAKDTPDDGNFTYKGKLSPFARIGANYNFMFKSVPDYQGYVGIRLGGTMFSYDVTDIRYHNSYWKEDVTTSVTGQHRRALWYEAVAGLKVKIWKRLSLGWQIKFHNLIGENKGKQGNPWFIPGYGTRNGSLAFAFSAFYTLPLHKADTTGQNTGIAEPTK